MIPPESGDLIERIGRTVEAYAGLGAHAVAIEVSPEAEYELRRLTRTRDMRRLRVGGLDLPVEVRPKMIGLDAYKVRTAGGYVTPEMARARYFANRSITR